MTWLYEEILQTWTISVQFWYFIPIFQFNNSHLHLCDLWKIGFSFLLKFKGYLDWPSNFKGKTKIIAWTFESHSKETTNGDLWHFKGNISKLFWGITYKWEATNMCGNLPIKSHWHVWQPTNEKLPTRVTISQKWKKIALNDITMRSHWHMWPPTNENPMICVLTYQW